jgi:hypothetical protein
MADSPRKPVRLSVLQILAGLQSGSIINEIDGELTKLAKNVGLVGKAGTISIKLTVKPIANVPNGLYMGAEVAAKIPQPARSVDVLYSDKEGGLHANDPRQLDAFEQLKPRALGGGNFSRETGEVIPDQSEQSA